MLTPFHRWPQDGLIERVNARIKAQIEKIEDMTGSMDPKTNFDLIVIQTELERWKYLVRSFLRARIAKIDKHTLHYLTPPNAYVLSDAEIAYATRHSTLLHSHYAGSFLGSFPAALQRMDDTAGGISMVDGPDLETAVFVRVLRDGVAVEGKGRDEDDRMVTGRGEIVVARWSDVKTLVDRGDGELV